MGRIPLACGLLIQWACRPTSPGDQWYCRALPVVVAPGTARSTGPGGEVIGEVMDRTVDQCACRVFRQWIGQAGEREAGAAGERLSPVWRPVQLPPAGETEHLVKRTTRRI